MTTLSWKGSSKGFTTGRPAALPLISLNRRVSFRTSSYLSAHENKASKTSFSRPELSLPPSSEPVKVLAPPLHHHREKEEDDQKGFVQRLTRKGIPLRELHLVAGSRSLSLRINF